MAAHDLAVPLDEDGEPLRCDGCGAMIRHYQFGPGVTEYVSCASCRAHSAHAPSGSSGIGDRRYIIEDD